MNLNKNFANLTDNPFQYLLSGVFWYMIFIYKQYKLKSFKNKNNSKYIFGVFLFLCLVYGLICGPGELSIFSLF